jgi:hypothetical protein
LIPFSLWPLLSQIPLQFCILFLFLLHILLLLSIIECPKNLNLSVHVHGAVNCHHSST